MLSLSSPIQVQQQDHLGKQQGKVTCALPVPAQLSQVSEPSKGTGTQSTPLPVNLMVLGFGHRHYPIIVQRLQMQLLAQFWSLLTGSFPKKCAGPVQKLAEGSVQDLSPGQFTRADEKALDLERAQKSSVYYFSLFESGWMGRGMD